MSVVCARVYKDRIEMAADSICVWGESIMPDADKKICKLTKTDNDMVIGGVGLCEETSLLFHYIKTHTIETVNEKGILDYFIEFRRWKANLTGDNSMKNLFMIAYDGKCFCIEKMLVYEINNYLAIGAGRDYANGAMYMGASPREAVKAACDLCAFVAEPIICYSIPR